MRREFDDERNTVPWGTGAITRLLDALTRHSLLIACVLVLIAALPALAAGPGPGTTPDAPDYALRARALGEGVWVVEGQNADFSPANGCNIINTGFIRTAAGVLVINTGPSKRYGEQLRALIARTTPEPVAQVLHLNQHPDYFLGNQAFADVPRRATPTTRAGMAREGEAYATNLYRLCGEWMRGTEPLLPDADMPEATTPQRWTLGGREFEWRVLSGHTASDGVLIDRQSGVAFVGGLVFAQRVPTTPHARVPDWLASLDSLQRWLEAEGVRVLVPSHGPVQAGGGSANTWAEPGAGLAQTRDYLRWLDRQFAAWAAQGKEMNEVLRAPVPPTFRAWAAFDTEYLRNVAHLYPGYEQAALAPGRVPMRASGAPSAVSAATPATPPPR